MERLVLFDIDGTLLTSNGAAARAFRRALEDVFGTSGPERGYSFAGRTDPQIATDLLTMAGVPRDRIDADLPSVWPRYADYLETELRLTPLTVYPGVRPLLDRLHAAPDEAVLGLLTGNIVEGARLKLTAAELDFERFQVGAFGSDHADRTQLPEVAIDRAAALFGRRFEGKDVVVIGDTPSDVACGRHLGVRTVAVATGSYSRTELAECAPDHLFDDLSDIGAIWECVFDRPPNG